MKNWNFKKINIIGGILIGLGGIVMLCASFIPIDDSFTQETKSFSADNIKNLTIESKSDDVEIIPSTDGKIGFDYYESKHKKYIINQQGTTLEIKQDIKPYYSLHFIDFQFGRFKSQMPRKLTVYLPEGINFEQFKLKDSYGDVKTYTVISAKNGEFNIDCGDIDMNDQNFENLKIDMDYGSAIVNNLACDNLTFENDNGNITFDGLNAKQADFSLDYGKLSLSNATVQDAVTVENGNGNVNFNNIKSGKTDILLRYGDANINGLDSDNFNIMDSNGDIKVSGLVGNSECVVKNSYGDIDIEDSELKKSDVRANNGEINISDCIFEDMELDNDYGDIEVKLKDSFENYTISAKSNFGDVNIPDKAMGDKWLKAETQNGDIKIY